MINLIKENEFMVHTLGLMKMKSELILCIKLAYDICVIAMIWLDWKIYIR